MIQIRNDSFSLKFPPKESRRKTGAFDLRETRGDRNLNTTDVWTQKGYLLLLLGVVGLIFIPALGRQKQVDICEFKVNLVYIAISKPARTT